jgi:hypothetical protein
MYMPGRFRTASIPRKTLIWASSYLVPGVSFVVLAEAFFVLAGSLAISVLSFLGKSFVGWAVESHPKRPRSTQ